MTSDYPESTSPLIVFPIEDSGANSASIQSRHTITKSEVSISSFWIPYSGACLPICSHEGLSMTSIASKTSYPGFERLSFKKFHSTNWSLGC